MKEPDQNYVICAICANLPIHSLVGCVLPSADVGSILEGHQDP
jgi:hypothetical protein